MNKVLLLIFSLISLNVFTKNKDDLGPFTVAFFTGKNFPKKAQWLNYNEYIQSYNKRMAHVLKTDMPYPILEGGRVIGGEIQIMGICIGYLNYRYKSYIKSELINGAMRETNFNLAHNILYLDIILPIKAFGGIGIANSIYRPRGYFASNYVYPNGYRSYIDDKLANGIYSYSKGSSQNTLGLRVDFGFACIQGSFRVEKSLKIYESRTEKILGPEDLLIKNSNLYHTYDAHHEQSYGNGTANGLRILSNTFKGVFYSLSLRLSIGKYKF